VNISVALYNHSSVIWERLCSGKGSNALEDQSPQRIPKKDPCSIYEIFEHQISYLSQISPADHISIKMAINLASPFIFRLQLIFLLLTINWQN
jgi:hypothetical protein